MKRRNLTIRFLQHLVLGMMVLGIHSCMKGPTMGRNSPFQDFSYDHFNDEAQSLEQGIGPDDFQVSVSLGGKLDLLRYYNGSLHRERIGLDGMRILTSASTLLVGESLFVFQGHGGACFANRGAKPLWHRNFGSDFDITGELIPSSHESVIGFHDELKGGRGKDPSSIIHLRRFHPQNEEFDELLQLPIGDDLGMMELHQLPHGFLDVRSWRFDAIEDTVKEIAHYYTYEGKPEPHPLARALNLLHSQGIDLNHPNHLPAEGAFYPSRTRDTWGLFVWSDLPQFPGKHLFILSSTDTIQGVPVTCDRMSLNPSNSLQAVLVHPSKNVFLVVAKYQDADSVEIYLGRVRKDSSGKVYRPETFRVGSFPKIEQPILSRNGEVLAFATFAGEQTHLVFSRLTDLVADVNRRYPDAKFDLEALK
jgi:hypothetical protein